ncbi:hypothetical protein EA187_14005 [Lujinxingia sediminis]|uniref:phosphomevalonate kinase n=1 Tax=Lujinxingia sediminis TaxID=2480984 RepID=A0ABY0CRC5_9DELT|nr:hypothetical protein [Lujinxingia sediminis]RVU42946.1 hypothetical protein EA187_14005 [Lujinxingia sediminis]
MPAPAVSAPAKLFLFGEYAVLGGARALVHATKRRVTASLTPGQHAYRVVGADLSSSLALPCAALSALHLPTDADVLRELTLDVGDLYEGGQKLGLGSSAASTVAIIKALAPHLSPAQTFDVAHRAHRALQGGRGSGADVASSAFGGTIAYRLTTSSLPAPVDLLPRDLQGREGEAHIADAAILPALQLPSDLKLTAVWTGEPASSVSFIKGLTAAWHKDFEAVASTLQALGHQAERALDACLSDDTALWLDALAQADQGMERLGDICDLPITTPAHRRLREQARTLGALVKPSGAGGGDFSLVAWHRSHPAPSALFTDAITLDLH